MATAADVYRDIGLQAMLDRLIASGTVSTLVFETTGGTVIATCFFSSSAFASAAAGVSSAAAITADTSAIAGTIEQVNVKDPGGTSMLVCTIATDTTQDFTLPALDISDGDTVGCTSLTFTFPAT
jgi:hypothetical protein